MRTDVSIHHRLVALSHNIGGICPHRPSHNFHNIKKRYKFLSVFEGTLIAIGLAFTTTVIFRNRSGLE